MGWTSYHRAPGQSDRDHLAAELLPGTKLEFLDTATVRTTFYAAVRNNGTGQVWGLVVLQRRNRGEYNYSRKEMDENMGPVEDRCPDRILDLLSPTDHEWASEWRTRCRARNAAKRDRPKVAAGSRIRLDHPVTFTDDVAEDTFTLVQRSTLRRAGDGVLVRLTAWRERPFTVLT